MGSGIGRPSRTAAAAAARVTTARVTTARVTTARPAAGGGSSAGVDLTQPRSSRVTAPRLVPGEATQPRSARVRFRTDEIELDDEIPDCELGESLDGEDAGRLFADLRSARSAVPSSRGGDDDGSDGGDLEAEYSHVITERSAPALVAQVERDFTPPLNLELEVVGRAVPRLLSGYQKSRREEQQVLQTLREEGLIATPAERASSGVSFEIVSASSAGSGGAAARCTSAAARLPSATLDRLEARRHRHRRPVEPETDQLVKQRRRRAAEEEKVRKLLVRKQQVEQGQLQAEEMHQQLSQEREASLERRVGSAIDKRQRHLNELRQRLREKHDRVKQAPLRRAQDVT